MMDGQFVSSDGYSIRLTGHQVRFIRNVLGESRATFSKRFAVQPPVIYRLEKKGDQAEDGPLVILIHLLAKTYAIDVPEHPLRRISIPSGSQSIRSE